MRTIPGVGRRFSISHDKSTLRRRRLYRGSDRWNQDWDLSGRGVTYAVWLTFTSVSEDVNAVQGHMRRVWSAVRAHWGPLTYFCWLELQRRGAAHYHAIVLNPPRRSEGFNWK